jgi:polyhydroxyalkanoate synthesis regulator phasin
MKNIIKNWLGVTEKSDFDKLNEKFTELKKRLLRETFSFQSLWSKNLESYLGMYSTSEEKEVVSLEERLEKLEEYLGVSFVEENKKFKGYKKVKK